MDITGKTAFITGGASGLGEACARLFIQKGANIAIADLNEARGQALATELGAKALYLPCNVSDEANVRASLEKTAAHFGALHIVVNCAGIATPQKILDRENKITPLAHFRKLIEVNLIGSYTVLALASEIMAQNKAGADQERGVIINTASVAAFEGQIGQAAYSASKGGIASLALPAAREFARYGIRVMTIAPGFMHTPLFDGLPEKAVASLTEQVQFPKRLGQAGEYAKLALHIIENNYLNGEAIRLDAAARMAPK